MSFVPLPWTVSFSLTLCHDHEIPELLGNINILSPPSLYLVLPRVLVSPWLTSMFLTGTEGLTRGAAARDTGAPITIPVGPGTLGRILNVTGDPIDERGPVKADKFRPIHTEAPEFVEQSTEAEILVTGIKVVDLLAPYARGGKIGLFGGAGVGKTVFIQELIVSLAILSKRNFS